MKSTPTTTHEGISATEPDWSRERLTEGWWDPGRQLVLTIRRYQKWKARGSVLGYFMCKISVLQHRFWSVVASAEIPIDCNPGGGFRIPHPNGVVIHPRAKIGPNCLFFQQVTVVNGTEIGGHVDIGAGVKIMGPFKIGDHAKIGANAVVLCDVPPGATAVGIPARIILPKDRKQDSQPQQEDPTERPATSATTETTLSA